MRMPTLKKRIDILWIAAALVAGAGSAVSATASSPAEDDRAAGGNATAGTLPLTAVGDPALASTDPTDAEALAKLAVVAGLPAAADAAPQTWQVGDQTALGYTAADGRFCFEFRGLAGGCLHASVLTDEQPVDLFTDHGPRLFHAYGLARDGVTAVTIRIGGASHQAALAHNSFFFSDDALGGTTETSGEIIATMSDGTARTQRFPISSLAAPLASP